MERRTRVVEAGEAGATVGAVVRNALRVPWSAARRLCARGKVTVDGAVVTDAGARVRAGSTVVVDPSASRREPGLARERLVYLDAQLVVVDKPAGVNTVPFEPGERGTLVDQLGVALHRWDLAPANAPLFVVHRLDRETTGLLVFGRTWTAKRHLAGLFRRHAVERVYDALVHGTLRGEHTLTSWLVEDRGDGLRGSARRAGEGQRAVTHVRAIAALPGGATRVECRLETGRQHQIRIHLAERGHPLVGERVYVRDYAGPRIPAPRVMLHARVLGFRHPVRDETLRFEAAPPEDFTAMVRGMGGEG